MTERAREMIESIQLQHGNGSEHAPVHVGVAKLAIAEKTSVNDLLEAANGFMKMAQQAGGNQVSYDKSSEKVDAVVELTVEQALHLISNGEAAKVKGQVDGLIKRILPLLGLYAKVNAKGMKQLIQKMMEKI